MKKYYLVIYGIYNKLKQSEITSCLKEISFIKGLNKKELLNAFHQSTFALVLAISNKKLAVQAYKNKIEKQISNISPDLHVTFDNLEDKIPLKTGYSKLITEVLNKLYFDEKSWVKAIKYVHDYSRCGILTAKRFIEPYRTIKDNEEQIKKK